VEPLGLWAVSGLQGDQAAVVGCFVGWFGFDRCVCVQSGVSGWHRGLVSVVGRRYRPAAVTRDVPAISLQHRMSLSL